MLRDTRKSQRCVKLRKKAGTDECCSCFPLSHFSTVVAKYQWVGYFGRQVTGQPAAKRCWLRGKSRCFPGETVASEMRTACSKTISPGEVAEWLMAPVLKTGVPERVPGVRIPPSPPESVVRFTSENIGIVWLLSSSV